MVPVLGLYRTYIGQARAVDRAEQRLRMCIDKRGLGSKLVSFVTEFSKHPHIFPIFKGFRIFKAPI